MAIQAPSSGQVLGHYRLIEQIGAGGMGVVFRAHDEQLQRDVAVKILPTGLFANDAARKQFRQEALAVAKLVHPNIAMAFDFGQENGVDYLVTEYIPGCNLDEMLAQQSLPQKTVLELGRQLASGLEAAHRENVVHRDLKPGNLRVNPDGQLKILDFGLATLVEPIDVAETINLSTDLSLSGTVPYMAPELLRGEPADTRSDTWAAGAVLYEMATGKRAFPDRQPSLLMDAILHYDPVRPTLLNPEISPASESVILKALDRDPDMRYQSARELKVDLERLAAGTGPLLVPPMPRDRPQHRVRRKQWMIAALVGLVVAASVLLYIIIKHRIEGRAHQLSVLVAEFENRTGDPVFDQTPRELISTALGESHQAFVFPSSRIPEVLRRMQKPATVPIDENIGTEICTREGLQSVVSGSISKLGSSYLLLARVLNCNGELIASTQKEFSHPEELPSTIDEIAATIRHDWGESKAAIEQASLPLAQATSGSLEAVKLYSSGKQQLYLGNPRGAVSLFTKAVELDDNFAMAHEYLGVTYENLGDEVRAGKEYARAAQLADRVTEREREKTLGDYCLYRGNFDGAISHYRVLATLSPDDPAVHLNLAECYRNEYRFDSAIAEARKAVNLQPTPGPEINLATYYFLSGDSQQAMNLAQQVLQDHPDDLRAMYLIGSYYQAVNKHHEAGLVWQQMLGLGDDGSSRARSAMADAALARDNPQEATVQLESGLVADSNLKNGYELVRKKILLAEIYQMAGDEKSRQSLLQSLPQPDAPELIFLLGRLYARSGQSEDAQKQLRRLEQLPEHTATLQSYSNMLQSEIAAGQGRFNDAVQAARLGVQHLNSPLAIETLARAYELAGDRENAVREYELMLARSNERQFDGIDSPALAAVATGHYRLGMLYLALGRNDLAEAQFSSFLKYAAAGEHTGPLYEDAKSRMNALRGKSSPPANPLPPRKE